MKTNKLFLFLLAIIGFVNIQAQDRYWVQFTDKQGTTFEPYEYFDIKAIERRLNHGLSINDLTDYPLQQNYVDQVEAMVVSTGRTSRWFNMMAVKATSDQMDLVKQLNFVKQIIPINSQQQVASKTYGRDLIEVEAELLKSQLEIMEGPLFDSAGYNGTGVRIAVFDVGFISVDKNPAFKHIYDDKRVIATWDFTEDEEYVYRGGTHGTNVLSNIAGMYEDQKVGLAPKAEFLLARTEINREVFSEEENWLAAAEWADKNGAQIINSSLGYTKDRYFPEQMDGSSFVSRAATMAARKGILVINAMGNDGSSNWKYIGAPADADSILSIGGIDPHQLYHINFSSFGPTADMRRKPNVSAFGRVMVIGPKGLHISQGTSFSAPLVTGFAACAWQSNPDLTNMEMLEEIEKSGQLYPYFDYAHGYGIPQASYFLNKKTKSEPTFKIIKDSLKIKFIINDNAYEKEGNPYLYYHIQNEDNVLDTYHVLELIEDETPSINKDQIEPGQTLRVYYKGYSKEIKF